METDAVLGSRGQSDVGIERGRPSTARGEVDVAISANSIWISATRKRGRNEAPS